MLSKRQDKSTVETDFSNRKVELIHANSTAIGENKARMISELILRNREALSKKVINQFPSLKKTRPQLEMKHLEKELKRKRQNNGKIKTEINGVSRKMKTSELQSMSIRKEHKNKTLASFTDYLNPGIVSMDRLEAQRQWYLYEETAPHCSNAEVCLKSDARKQL